MLYINIDKHIFNHKIVKKSPHFFIFFGRERKLWKENGNQEENCGKKMEIR